jgi:hypothetical protein
VGETRNRPFQFSFNSSLKVDFQVRELDERLGLSELETGGLRSRCRGIPDRKLVRAWRPDLRPVLRQGPALLAAARMGRRALAVDIDGGVLRDRGAPPGNDRGRRIEMVNEGSSTVAGGRSEHSAPGPASS